MGFDNLGTRMKDYENVSRIYLTKRSPVIIRLDGKAFHTFTKGFNKPFDDVFIKSMLETTKYLCANIMNCKMAYTQSDEISLLLVDYDRIENSTWFENNLQKMVSISASMATLAFNKAFIEIASSIDNSNIDVYARKFNTALFDSRAFVVPPNDICNYFIWRQQDAIRNSIQMVAQSLFHHKELMGLSCEQLKEKMKQEKDVDWASYDTAQKLGRYVVKELYDKDGVSRTRWIAYDNTPTFIQERNYIDKFIG